MKDPLSYSSFKPVLHNWCNKGSRGGAYKITHIDPVVVEAGFLSRIMNDP